MANASKNDLNAVAEEYCFCQDDARKAELKNELWTQSFEFLVEETRFERDSTWNRFDVISEAACHMPAWIERFDPKDSLWTTYIVSMFKGMRQNSKRPKNIHHRFHESAVKALNSTLQKGIAPDDAIKEQLIGESPKAQEGILDAWFAIRVKPQSLNTPIGEVDGQEITLEQSIKDNDAHLEFSAVINRESRTPVLRKLHRKHRILLEQLLDRIPFRHLDFGEALSLPQKAIRISEAIARLRVAVETS